MNTYDVVVAGGGAGGVGAAIGAAKAGARVVLVEKFGFLGGAATSAQVLAYCGFFHQGDAPIQAVAGAGEDVLEAMRDLGIEAKPYHSPTTENWIVLLEPERLKVALDRVCAAHGVDVRLHSRINGASVVDGMIRTVEIGEPAQRINLAAPAFVDASGDAVLARTAGVLLRVGDGAGGIQAYTMPLRIGGLAPGTRIDREDIKRAVTRYNERSNDPIHRADGGIYTRVPGTTDFWWLIVDRDMPDLSAQSFTRAEQRAREMGLALVEVMRTEVPGFENAWLAQTGPQIGVRESRHPAAKAEVQRDDVIAGRLHADGIARAAWPIELHGEAGRPVYERIGGAGYYHVPYGAICAEGIGNLWYAGRVIGADAAAYGSIRVMGTAFATGEAAGASAALMARSGTFPGGDAVRTQLAAQGALL